ncbi:MAG: hypothetical protein HUJ25_14055 [Crocinitomicaceae bacterium]|nr:hypothetical protein [Crocinitomicaceae bacterium]
MLNIIGVLLLFTACNKGKNNPESCNGESTRRDIKLVIDDAAMEVDTIPIVTTVDSIGSIELPEADKNTERLEIEKRTFTVTGLVHKVSKHRDGDYKIKFISDNEKYLNCEAPNTGCAYADSSRFYEQFKAVRAFIEQYEDELEGETLTITGVAFIDIDHKYPRNAAENEIELHPILNISF